MVPNEGIATVSSYSTSTVSTTASRPEEEDDFAIDDPHSADNVYKNLIITEHALRMQYMRLQRSRRQGMWFLWSVLSGAMLLTYRVCYCTPHYTAQKFLEQVLMVALYIAIGLFFLTGMYTKTFRTAPRFLPDTNKGLKSLNFRLVKTSVPFVGKFIRFFYDPTYSTHPAGPLKLVLSTREFSPEYIENWEVFRDEYWQRQALRKRKAKLKRKKMEKAEKRGILAKQIKN